jgi:hypothetical protein
VGTRGRERDRAPVSRFRHDRGRAVAGLIVTISLLTLVAVSPWFALLLVPPAAWTGWVWRAGTDADRHGLRVRALLGRRDLPWSQVSALHPDRLVQGRSERRRGRDSGRLRRLAGGGGRDARHRRLVATLTDGTEVPLTAVTVADAGRLVAASGGELTRTE